MKKEWEKPTVTIVTKSTTEENVLNGCKNNPNIPEGQAGPFGDHCATYWDFDPIQHCVGSTNS